MLFPLLLLQTPAYGLPADPTLDTRLAIEARIEPLPRLLERIGKSLGTTLVVERRMEGLKATIFSPARPARLTLAGLASVFDAEWAPRKEGGYRLQETVPARNRREAYMALEDADRKARVKAFLQIEGASNRKMRPDEGKSPGQFAAEAGFGGAEAALRRTYHSLGAIDRERFWRGETMHAIGEFPGEPAAEAFRESGPGWRAVNVPVPPGRILLLFRSRPDEGGIRYITLSPKFNGGSSQQLPLSRIGAELHRSAFRKAQDLWLTNLKTSDAAALGMPLATFKAVKPPWPYERWTNTDVLETVYRATGIPIVAEAFRRFRDAPEVPVVGTLRDVLRGARLAGTVRCEDGMLLHRPSDFWSLRRVEPPEVALVPLETAPATPPEGLLDAAATTFAMLPRESLGELPRSAVRRDISELVRGTWALRLWGRLTPREREAALEKNGLSLASMKAEAREALREAVVEAIFGLQAEFLAGLDVNPDPGAPGSARTRRVESALKLLDLAPAGSFTLQAERSVRQRVWGPLDPPGQRKAGPSPQKGLSLQIADAEGYGLVLFAPEPSGP